MQKFPSQNEKGQSLITVLVIAAILAIIGTVMASQYVGGVKSSYLQMDRELYHVNLKSAIETFASVYRLANARYSQNIENCTQANDLAHAIGSGHGCPGLGPYTIFSAADVAATNPTSDWGGSFPNPCQINQIGSSCGVTRPIFHLAYGLLSFDIYFNGLITARNMSEFVAVYSTPAFPQALAQRFAIQGTLPLTSHLDSSNSVVVAEGPSTFQSCQFSAWTPLRYGTACNTYGELGSGAGLALYNEDFFGLRASDGQVVELGNLNSATYMVQEDGTLGGQSVFPPYCKDQLVNADDFTVLDNSDHSELYIVTGQGSGDPNAPPGVLSGGSNIAYIEKVGGTCNRHVICDLGKQNWSQGYAGLAIEPTSNILIPPADLANNLPLLVATFYLKTDTGKILNTQVVSRAGNFAGADPSAVYDPALNRTFICTSNYDTGLQVAERVRTLGFERGFTNSTRYIVY